MASVSWGELFEFHLGRDSCLSVGCLAVTWEPWLLSVLRELRPSLIWELDRTGEGAVLSSLP